MVDGAARRKLGRGELNGGDVLRRRRVHTVALFDKLQNEPTPQRRSHAEGPEHFVENNPNGARPSHVRRCWPGRELRFASTTEADAEKRMRFDGTNPKPARWDVDR